jgi:hypothetical protein
VLGVSGYRYKKDLKAAVGQKLNYVETSWFGNEFEPNGRNTVVGPCAYTMRNWYAIVTCKDGVIVKVE